MIYSTLSCLLSSLLLLHLWLCCWFDSPQVRGGLVTRYYRMPTCRSSSSFKSEVGNKRLVGTSLRGQHRQGNCSGVNALSLLFIIKNDFNIVEWMNAADDVVSQHTSKDPYWVKVRWADDRHQIRHWRICSLRPSTGGLRRCRTIDSIDPFPSPNCRKCLWRKAFLLFPLNKVHFWKFAVFRKGLPKNWL